MPVTLDVVCKVVFPETPPLDPEHRCPELLLVSECRLLAESK